jgi:hypothetical protein
MIGPNHSIMARFTCGGHGAAEWTTRRSDDTSYFARTDSGRFSMRTKCVGTKSAWVTAYRSMAARAASASNRSNRTTVPPMA